MTFPRSFILLKLVLLFLFVFSYFFASRKIKVYYEVIIFYSIVASIGIIWSIIGIINGGSLQGVFDNFRLYFFWSFMYMFIFTIIRNEENIEILHWALAYSGILIFLINIFGLFNDFFKLGFVSEELTNQLQMRVGIHKGYIQITSHNIGSLFFIVPYLVSFIFRKDSAKLNSNLTKLSLICSILIAALSGRRALWLVVFFSPLIIAGLSYITGSGGLFTKNFKRLIRVYIAASVLLLFGIGFLFQNKSIDNASLNHIKAAFAATDLRSIQKGFLIDGFYNYPIFGSGFGMKAGIIRSEEATWLYELTYHQILFNFGIVGSLLLLFLYLLYISYVIFLIRRNQNESFIAFSILIGFFSFLIAAYSNPYFGSFDCLLYIGLLPYLATYRKGFRANDY